MAITVNVALYFSEIEWRIATDLEMDVVEICREAIKEEIRSRAEVRQIVNKTQNIVEENTRLREENLLLKEQLLTVEPAQPERALLQRLGMVR